MEKLYFNGDILTMEGEEHYVEAVLVADGKIKAAGTYAEVTELKSDDCELIDLQGKTLMPSFIDTPVIKPDLLHAVWTAVNRLSRNGVVVGEEQKVGVYDALKAITINAAYAYFEENEKGSIREGKRADLVILDANPMKVEPIAIRDIKVLETIKDGVTVYTA